MLRSYSAYQSHTSRSSIDFFTLMLNHIKKTGTIGRKRVKLFSAYNNNVLTEVFYGKQGFMSLSHCLIALLWITRINDDKKIQVAFLIRRAPGLGTKKVNFNRIIKLNKSLFYFFYCFCSNHIIYQCIVIVSCTAYLNLLVLTKKSCGVRVKVS